MNTLHSKYFILGILTFVVTCCTTKQHKIETELTTYEVIDVKISDIKITDSICVNQNNNDTIIISFYSLTGLDPKKEYQFILDTVWDMTNEWHDTILANKAISYGEVLSLDSIDYIGPYNAKNFDLLTASDELQFTDSIRFRLGRKNVIIVSDLNNPGISDTIELSRTKLLRMITDDLHRLPNYGNISSPLKLLPPIVRNDTIEFFVELSEENSYENVWEFMYRITDKGDSLIYMPYM